jgi:Kef-type K+ transport system membrane component KefB
MSKQDDQQERVKYFWIAMAILLAIALFAFPGTYFIAIVLDMIPKWIAPYVFWAIIIAVGIVVSHFTEERK